MVGVLGLYGFEFGLALFFWACRFPSASSRKALQRGEKRMLPDTPDVQGLG